MKGKEFDIIYGLHSNIPACCIVFYVTEWQNEFHRDSPYARAVHADVLNYIPCPECMALNRQNVLRLCEDECQRNCAREFTNREPTALEVQQFLNVAYMIQDRKEINI